MTYKVVKFHIESGLICYVFSVEATNREDHSFLRPLPKEKPVEHATTHDSQLVRFREGVSY